jgi:hypothetical protein
MDDHEGTQTRTLIGRGVAIALSALAISGLMAAEAMPAATIEPIAASTPAAAVTREAGARRAQSPVDRRPAADEVRPADDAAPEPEGVVVPDFTGMTLRDAKRAAEPLGLKVSGYEDGAWVPLREASYYRVTWQRSRAGTEVPSGKTIEVHAEPRVFVARGY